MDNFIFNEIGLIKSNEFKIYSIIRNNIMRLKSIYFLVFIFLFAGCINEESQRIKDNLPFEKFTIKCGSDTTLVSKNGISINVKSNSFDCTDKDTEIMIKLFTIKDKSDMIKYRAYTIDEKGNFLESAGMFKIEFESTAKFEINKGIKVNIPALYADKRMQLFKSEGVTPNWVLTDNKIDIKNIQKIDRGEKLFSQNCLNCHSNNFKELLTGPALGNITSYRDMDWLIKFTKNSQKLIASEDSLSICIWEKWAPTVMTNFESLSDSEIESIYTYINNESKKQGIGKDEVSFAYSCNVDTVFSESQNVIIIDTSDVNNYSFNIFSSGWYNVDYFINFSSIVDNILIEIPKEKIVGTTIVLYFIDRNMVIPFENITENKFILFNAAGKSKINLPKEAVKIIGYRIHPSNNELTEIVVKDYLIKDHGNTLFLDFEPIGEKDFYESINKDKLRNSKQD